jgi:O-antigen ligase
MLIYGSRITNGRIDIKTFVERAITILFITYPVLLLSVRDGTSVCYVLLLVLSLLYLFRLGWRNIDWSHSDIAFTFAMAFLFGATLISQLYHLSFRFDSLDSPSRFLFAVPIYLMLRSAPCCPFGQRALWLSFPRALEYGFPLGAIAGLLTSFFFPSTDWLIPATYFVDPAQFGGAILSLGFLSLSTINWTRRDPLGVVGLKLLGFIVGIYGAIETGERGVWIAIPALLILLAYHQLSWKWRAAVAVIAVVAGLASYWAIPTVRDRIAYTQTELTNVVSRSLDTSLGLRLQIWNATIEIIRENPIFGIGPAEEVIEQFRAMHQRGWFTGLGFEAASSQVHNEILANTARLGIFGLLSILAIYFIPMNLFVKAATASVGRVKAVAGVMGTSFVAAYFIVGLTIETFNIKTIATFYALTVATLLAIAHHTTSKDASDVTVESLAIE